MAKYFYMVYIVVLCLAAYASAEPGLGKLIGKMAGKRLLANVWGDAHEGGPPGGDSIDDDGY